MEASLIELTTYNTNSSIDLPILSFEVKPITEGNKKHKEAEVTLKLNKPITETIQIVYNTYNLKAKAGTDYKQIKKGKIKFQPGDQEETFEIKILGDKEREKTEQFGIKFVTKEDNVYIQSQDQKEGRLRVTIKDNDKKNGNETETEGDGDGSVNIFGNLGVDKKYSISFNENGKITNFQKSLKPQKGASGLPLKESEFFDPSPQIKIKQIKESENHYLLVDIIAEDRLTVDLDKIEENDLPENYNLKKFKDGKKFKAIMSYQIAWDITDHEIRDVITEGGKNKWLANVWELVFGGTSNSNKEPKIDEYFAKALSPNAYKLLEKTNKGADFLFFSNERELSNLLDNNNNNLDDIDASDYESGVNIEKDFEEFISYFLPDSFKNNVLDPVGFNEGVYTGFYIKGS